MWTLYSRSFRALLALIPEALAGGIVLYFGIKAFLLFALVLILWSLWLHAERSRCHARAYYISSELRMQAILARMKIAESDVQAQYETMKASMSTDELRALEGDMQVVAGKW
jgi:hypothetical protein